MSSSVNILLVDDEARNLDVLESFLKSPDYNLVRASSADEALLLLLNGKFAAIVLDIQMPGISGIELASLIKERKRTQHIPIIFLTAYYQEDKDVLQGYGKGAVDYLTKPINPQILKSKIDVFVDLYRKTHALVSANAALEAEIGQRLNVEAALHRANGELEARVSERTADLNRANQELRDREAALRASESQAKAASRAKDEFLAALSHELRTPLNPVLLLSTEAAANTSLPDKVRADFRTIAKNVALEARLIDDLLDLTRISHGKMSLERQAFDIHAALEHSLSLAGAEVEQKKIQLRCAFAARKSIVLGDEVRLKQALWNVVNNAVKFSPDGETVVVATENGPGASAVTIEIADKGIGMTEDEISRIFNPFAQGNHVSEDGNRRFGGLGLGLAICKSMIEQHNGTITAASEGRNMGTTFTITLPLGSPSHSTNDRRGNGSSPRANSAAASDRVNGRVLLVEDHSATSSVLKKLLLNRRYVVTAAACIAEARAAASAESFDILISDLGLPDGDGCELMKELSRDSSIIGIALSGYGMDCDRRRTEAAGFTSHLVKPIRVEDLDRALSLAKEARWGTAGGAHA